MFSSNICFIIQNILIWVILIHIIELSGKFVPMLKENWNAENLNFSIHLLNYIG